MPTVLDATVVNQAYDTSGSGGRKLVRLDNGWLVSALTYSVIYFYVSKDNGLTWQLLTKTSTGTGFSDVSIVSNGNYIYGVAIGQSISVNVYFNFDATTVSETVDRFNLDTGQTSTNGFNGVSLAINEAGTELHATWASKNSTYPNSFNIRYAKGTINADGSVTWGAVEQVTTINAVSRDVKNPTVVVNYDNEPIIMFDALVAGTYSIKERHKKSGSWVGTNTTYGDDIYVGGTYAQSSPSAIFVPQEINGLPNGRIWVAWHGLDSLDNRNNLRISYSDDGGVNWSAMDKLTTGNSYNMIFPSITANSKNEIYILYFNNNADGLNMLKNVEGSWEEPIIVNATSAARHPSALYDSNSTFEFDNPLFIYMNNSKVGFYGTWTVTNISVPQGNIGQITDKNNLLSYNITTDGEMSEVIEKVNGAEVGRKTLASGESTQVSLTQEQWDAVRFGKYGENINPNIIPSFNDASWRKHAYTVVDSDTQLTLNATETGQNSNIDIEVSPNQEYFFSIETDGQYFVHLQGASTTITSRILEGVGSGSGTFKTTSDTVKVRIVLANPSHPKTYYFKNPTLKVGNSLYNRNVLTIEMGNNKWTYTFDKQLADDAGLLSIGKATQDANEVFLPAVKQMLVDALQSKEAVINYNVTFDEIEQSIKTLKTGTKKITGIGATNLSGVLTVTGLSFRPKLIRWKYNQTLYGFAFEGDSSSLFSNGGSASMTGFTVNDGGFTIGTGLGNTSGINWTVYGD